MFMLSTWATAWKYYTCNGIKNPNRTKCEHKKRLLLVSICVSVPGQTLMFNYSFPPLILTHLFQQSRHFPEQKSMSKWDKAEVWWLIPRPDNTGCTKCYELNYNLCVHLLHTSNLLCTIFVDHKQMWMQICTCPFSGGEFNMCWKWETGI